jgi:hypothetical protein
MASGKSKSIESQRGNATSTALMVLSGVALATSAILTVNQGLKKSRESTDQTGLERRLNESAIQAVTQLVTNGILHNNGNCKRIEPAETNTEYTFSGCGKVTNARKSISCSSTSVSDSTWLYSWDEAKKVASIQVCVKSTEDGKGKIEEKRQLVTVQFTGYDTPPADYDGSTRTYALVKSQPSGRNSRGAFFSSLNGRISLGLTSGNSGLIGKHGAADTCFYMRPASSALTRSTGKDLAFKARSKTGAYTFAELEPRPDGPNADEYGRNTDVGTKAPEGYELLSEFREKLFKDFYKGDFRGNRPESESWSNNASAWTPGSGRSTYKAEVITETNFVKQTGETFIGVMPKIPNGPNFVYFLASNPSNKGEHWHGSQFEKWNPAYKDAYKAGCESSAQDGSADFCTKVEVPLKSYKATMANKCKKTKRSLDKVAWDAAPQKMYADRAIQTSCNPAWIDKVEELLKKESAKTLGMAIPSGETTAVMATQALEVDDVFLKKEGAWAGHPIRAAYDAFAANFKGEGVTVLDDYTIEYTSDKDVGSMVTTESTDKDGNVTTSTNLVITYTGQKRDWDIEGIDKMPDGGVGGAEHVSKSCAYFKYYNPEQPKACSIAFVTKDDKGFVCRNNDGCFDELTKIRMADGSDRIITNLRKGELVWNPVTNKPARITKLTIGPENKPLLNVTIGNSTVRVTDSHPFMTRRGWVMARDLNKGVEVLTSGKNFLPVSKVELGASGRTVVNLALEGPADQHDLHYVLADGVVTGDLVIQNMIAPRAAGAGKGQ